VDQTNNMVFDLSEVDVVGSPELGNFTIEDVIKVLEDGSGEAEGGIDGFSDVFTVENVNVFPEVDNVLKSAHFGEESSQLEELFRGSEEFIVRDLGSEVGTLDGEDADEEESEEGFHF